MVEKVESEASLLKTRLDDDGGQDVPETVLHTLLRAHGCYDDDHEGLLEK